VASPVSPPVEELHLLLEWPQERTRAQWAAIFSASIGIHLLLFALAVRLPRLVGDRRPEPPERRVIVHKIPLYLPPDVLTQKPPNRREVSKHIDLADLLSSQQAQARRAAPRPSTKRFEMPKQVQPKQLAQNTPQILPQAPEIPLNQPQAQPPPGTAAGLPTPPPPKPAEGPFQNIGSEAPVNPNPKLAPPKDTVQAAISGLTEQMRGTQPVISDDNSSEPSPGTPGSIGRNGAQHSAVELKSDPQSVDFRPYLAQILTIVRSNWRRVIPESARMGTLRGRTVLEFVITKEGNIPKLVIADSSGSDPLDRAAVAGLSMSRLPPLPVEYKGYQVRLAFSFAYNMPSQ
jgi:TonB family protein